MALVLISWHENPMSDLAREPRVSQAHGPRFLSWNPMLTIQDPYMAKMEAE